MNTQASPEMLQEFALGVLLRDVKRVAAALDAGVDASETIALGTGAFHPLELLLAGAGGSYMTLAQNARAVGIELDHMPTKEEYIKQGSEIVGLLLAKNPSLVENINFTKLPVYFVARLMTCPYPEETADIVIETLRQTLEKYGEVYVPPARDELIGNIAAQLRGRIPSDPGGNDVLKKTIVSQLQNFEDVHAAVREKLENPSSSAAQKLVQDYGAVLGYWLNYRQEIPVEQIVNKLIPSGTAAAPQRAAENIPLHEDFVQILPEKDPEEVLADLAGIPGTDNVRQDSQNLLDRSARDKARGLDPQSAPPRMLNTVFEASDNTDTAVLARNRAELLHTLGLTGNRYVEINGENMASLFNDNNLNKVVDLFRQTDVIFLNRVYGLMSKGNMGAIVMEALTDALKSRPGKLTVFLSGEAGQMKKFFAENPVLEERFRLHRISLGTPTPEELGVILDKQLEAAKLEITADARKLAVKALEADKGGNTLVAIWSMLDAAQDRKHGNDAVITAEDVVAVSAATSRPPAKRLGFDPQRAR